MKKKKNPAVDAEWAEAKRLCRLTDEDVRKAKQLSFSPRNLIKNRPSKSQRWKAPVPIWIRELYERSLARAAAKQERKANPGAAPSPQAQQIRKDTPKRERRVEQVKPRLWDADFDIDHPSDREPGCIPGSLDENDTPF